MFDAPALGREIVSAVKSHVDRAVEPLQSKAKAFAEELDGLKVRAGKIEEKLRDPQIDPPDIDQIAAVVRGALKETTNGSSTHDVDKLVADAIATAFREYEDRQTARFDECRAQLDELRTHVDAARRDIVAEIEPGLSGALDAIRDEGAAEVSRGIERLTRTISEARETLDRDAATWRGEAIVAINDRVYAMALDQLRSDFKERFGRMEQEAAAKHAQLEQAAAEWRSATLAELAEELRAGLDGATESKGAQDERLSQIERRMSEFVEATSGTLQVSGEHVEEIGRRLDGLTGVVDRNQLTLIESHDDHGRLIEGQRKELDALALVVAAKLQATLDGQATLFRTDIDRISLAGENLNDRIGELTENLAAISQKTEDRVGAAESRLDESITHLEVARKGQEALGQLIENHGDGIDRLTHDIEDLGKQVADCRQTIAELPVPKDGRPPTREEIEEASEPVVRRIVEALRRLAGVVITHDGHLAVTYSDGSSQDVGPVRGTDGKSIDPADVAATIATLVQAEFAKQPAPKDGQDGLGFEDFEVLYDGERGIAFRLSKGDQIKEWKYRLPVVIDRGVYRETEYYERGDSVSWAGSAWVAQQDNPGKPGEGAGNGWRLAIKTGRPGRDADEKRILELERQVKELQRRLEALLKK